MNSAFLSVGQENYILKGNQQSNFPWVKDKFVRESINVNNGFYLMLSKDYDRDIDILHTENHQYEASLKRSIEPGILKVFDTLVNKRNEIKTLTRLGNRVYLDTIELDDGVITERNHAIHTIVEQADHASGFNWPYFSFVTKDNFIFILNAFNKTFIQRYELPPHVTFVSHTFLSDTHDFYCICETSEQKFEYFNIDLDAADPLIVGPILSYPFAIVDNKQITGFHVRGSSRKEKINLNKQNMCFMLHDDILVGWNGSGEVQQISTQASNMYYLSDDKVLYMDTHEHVYGEETVLHSDIILIECLFGSFKSTKIYQDNDQRAEILNFGVDNTRERLIILSGIKNQKKRRDKFITLYDIKTEQILHQMKIFNREIIGRLKTNLYNFVEGHIYYNNKVIKIRYDLIDSKERGDIKENELFDHYDNIVKLKHRHDFIASGTPLQTCVYNRLAYMIKNKKQFKPDRIMILPYLHERRIYLNRRHESNQFYSICNRNKQKYILCLCINDNKLYIYTETGILKNRIKYDLIADQFGKPESVSENGSYLLFTKSKLSEYISLVFVNTEGLKVKSTINYPEKFKMHIENLLTKTNKKSREIQFFWDNYLGQLKNLKQVRVMFTLNDSGDILIRLKPKTEFATKKKKQLEDLQAFEDEDNKQGKYDKIHQCSIYHYIPSNDSVSNGKKEYVYFDSETDQLYDIQGVSMNEQYIFFWNLGSVWSLSLKTQIIQKLSLYISEEEQQTFVKRVRCGTNENVIAIRITQSPLKDCIIQWNLEKDKELSCYDIESKAITFQDPDGNMFILENDWIINCHSGCKLKCYNVKNSDFAESKFGFQYGHRMETNTHNWVIFRNFINLSFSYMTFVIKENFDQNSYSMVDYLFDIEGYDYVLNRNTIFTKGILVQHEYEKLSFILKNYLKLDPIYLEGLHYKNKENQIALHLALSAKNNQMVSLILHYMSKIDFAAVHLIKDIFKDLINVQNFIEYLEAIPFQTKQMENKQTLMLSLTREQTQEMDILVCTPSRCQYVDDVYFRDTMKERCNDNNALTYAVKIKSIQADWIINEEVGLDFLQELIKQNNKEVYETEYIQIIVDYLYTKFSSKIKKKIMPLFFLNFVSVYIMIFLAEKERNLMQHGQEYEKQHFQHTVIVWICFLFSLINLCILTLQTHNVGILIQYKRGWAWIDLFTFLLTLIIFGFNFTKREVVVPQRIIEALLLVFITLKSLYFLRLIGEIAPLIDIIFVIVSDIKYFMLIYIIGLLCFIMAFYIIGQNQEYLAEDDEDMPPYATISGAFDHVYLSSLGEFDSESYWGNDMTPILLFLFICMSFFMCIHLLNMLIAIMSESFANNNLHKESKREHSKLSFVVENWWLDSIDPIKDKEMIVHLIAAIPQNLTNFGNDEEKMRFNILNERINILQVNQAKQGQEFRDKTDELFKIQNAILNEVRQIRENQ